MERAEVAAGAAAMTVAASEFPPKKLARQLDFTPLLRCPVQHLSVQQSAVVQRLALPVSRPAAQTAVQPMIQQLAHPISKSALSSPVKVPESPRSIPQAAVLETKDTTPKKQKQCNCKNSRCLKLYCECFASGSYCDGCNCLNCHNNVDHEATRQLAVGATLERNPNAFRPKVANSPQGSQVGKQEVGSVLAVKHNRGCNCKKSGCLKKYCECFQANVLCSDNCKCLDCKNFEGSHERHAIMHGNSFNSAIYQETNAAINGAIGSSAFGNSPVSRKRKFENVNGMYNNQRIYHNAQYSQVSHLKHAASFFPSLPVPHGTSAQAVSKVTYRSPLAGVIQPQDVRELCSLLVLVSKESAKTFADKNMNTETKKQEDQVATSSCITLGEKANDQEGVYGGPSNNFTTEQTIRIPADGSRLDESDIQNGRPASPGTMALMCYEQDAELMEGVSLSRQTVGSENLSRAKSSEQELTESFVEQERVVLTKFRDYLTQLITRGSIKETMCSSLARGETETDGQPLRSDIFKNRHLGNASAKPMVPITNHSLARTNGFAFSLNNGFSGNIGHPVQDGMLRSNIEETVKRRQNTGELLKL